MASNFLNPGELFVDQFGFKQEPETIAQYAEFLRTEAGLSDQPVIDLAKIYLRFRMPTPILAPLKGQQGVLLDASLGRILINEDDPRVRRRFSEAHELIHYLFLTLTARQGQFGLRAGNYEHNTVEHLCNEGAAELLMPRSSFGLLVTRLGVSFATARYLAKLYDVSFTASLVQSARVATGRYAVVAWRMKHKPTELTKLAEMKSQVPLFGAGSHYMPPPQLRVEWAICGSAADYIPCNKSVADTTSVYLAWHQGVITEGDELLSLGKARRRCWCETYPFDAHGQRMVISLLRLDS